MKTSLRWLSGGGKCVMNGGLRVCYRGLSGKIREARFVRLNLNEDLIIIF